MEGYYLTLGGGSVLIDLGYQ